MFNKKIFMFFFAIALASFIACDSSTDDNNNENKKPTASAGSDQTIKINKTATLDATTSSDADGDTLTYKWEIKTKPANSNASISNNETVEATFTPDTTGEFTIELTVSDSTLSDTDEVKITVNNLAGFENTLTPKFHTNISNEQYTHLGYSEIALDNNIVYQAVIFNDNLLSPFGNANMDGGKPYLVKYNTNGEVISGPVCIDDDILFDADIHSLKSMAIAANNNNVYIIMSSRDAYVDDNIDDEKAKLLLYISNDAGENFSDPIIIDEYMSEDNDGNVTINLSNPLEYKHFYRNPQLKIKDNFLYIAYSFIGDIYLQKYDTTDKTGNPLSGIIEVDTFTHDNLWRSLTNMEIDSEGYVYFLYQIWDEGYHGFPYFAKSTDATATAFTTRVCANTAAPAFAAHENWDSQMAIAGSGDTAKVFVTWVDTKFATPGTKDKSDIFFSRSINGGQTFSAPIMINDNSIDQENIIRQCAPYIAYSNGKLAIIWDDYRIDSDGDFDISPKNEYSHAIVTSTDNGVTFTTTAKIESWDVSYEKKEGFSDLLDLSGFRSSFISDNSGNFYIANGGSFLGF